MIDNWIINFYDRTVSEAGTDGIKLADATSATVEHVARMLTTGEADMPSVDDIAAAMVSAEIAPTRKVRRSALPDEIDYLIAALADETILGRDDPRLAQAFPLGNGFDKTLGLWSPADYVGALAVRQVKADEASVAVEKFAAQVSAITDAMRVRGALITFELVTH